MIYSYKGIDYEVYTGPKGGMYILVNDKKKYVKSNTKKAKQEKDNHELSNSSRTKKDKSTGWYSYKNIIRKEVKHCCVCGKELTKTDTDYYDLTDYCARCALADGIITSLE